MLANTLVARATERGYRLVHDHLLQVVMEVLEEFGLSLSERQFDAQIWKHMAFAKFRNTGRPSSNDIEKFQADIPEIRDLIRKQFSGVASQTSMDRLPAR
jgi:hypothetical protein